MKKITIPIFKNIALVMLLFLSYNSESYGQCIRPDEYLNVVSNNSGLVQNIGTCSYSNLEYNTISGLLVGQSYQFISRVGATYGDGAQNFVTITDGANNVIAFGTSPLTVPNVTSATVRLHHATDAACGGGAVCNNSQLQYLPSCGIPSSLSSSALTSTSVTVSWGSVASATAGYEYVNSTVSTVPTGAGTPTSATTTSFSGLTPETNYYFYVRSNCGSGNFSNWSLLSYRTGYCVPSSTSALTYINNFSTTGSSTNITNNASGFTAGGYQDNYATSNVTSFAGGTINYSFSVVGGTTGVAIWIDVNNNLTFETTERVYNSNSYLADGTYTGAIAIPSGLALGQYRIRIRTDFNATSPDPCADSFNRTEAEDYKLTVVAAPVDAMDFNNIQWVTDGTNGSNSTLTVPANTPLTAYAEGYEAGVTEAVGAGVGVEAWIATYTTNTDPSTWPAASWVAATYTDNQGNNDNFSRALTIPVGTNYVASRWRLNGAAFTYGGYNGTWNGTTNNSIQVIVLPITNDECSGAQALTVGGVYGDNAVSTSNVSATASSQANPTTCFGYNGGDIWFQTTVPASGNLTIETGVTDANTGIDTVVTAYSGSCASLVQVGCDDDGATEAPIGLSKLSLTGLTPASTLYLRVYEYNNDVSGGFKISAYDASLSNAAFDSSDFTFYPNPVKDVLNLSYTSIISKIQVINLLGQEVLTKNTNTTESQVDMTSLSAGSYLVKVTSEGLVKTIKVLKQ